MESKSNLPQHVPLAWNLRKAAIEFGTTVDTLTKALNRVSASPDSNGLYSTKQLISALFGELHVQKVRTQRAVAKRVELANAATVGSLVDKAALLRLFSQVADGMKSRIENSELSRDAQVDLLRELSSVPLGISDIATRQSKLPRDGKRAVDADGDEDSD
jgi:hypothetical protein